MHLGRVFFLFDVVLDGGAEEFRRFREEHLHEELSVSELPSLGDLIEAGVDRVGPCSDLVVDHVVEDRGKNGCFVGTEVFFSVKHAHQLCLENVDLVLDRAQTRARVKERFSIDHRVWCSRISLQGIDSLDLRDLVQ